MRITRLVQNWTQPVRSWHRLRSHCLTSVRVDWIILSSHQMRIPFWCLLNRPMAILHSAARELVNRPVLKVSTKGANSSYLEAGNWLMMVFFYIMQLVIWVAHLSQNRLSSVALERQPLPFCIRTATWRFSRAARIRHLCRRQTQVQTIRPFRQRKNLTTRQITRHSLSRLAYLRRILLINRCVQLSIYLVFKIVLHTGFSLWPSYLTSLMTS